PLGTFAAAFSILLLAAVAIAITAAELYAVGAHRTLVPYFRISGPLLERLRLRLWRLKARLRRPGRNEIDGRLEIRLLRRIGGWGKSLGERGEAVRHAREIVIVLEFLLLVGGAAIAAVLLLLRGDQPEIMFGVLQQILRHNNVAGRLGVTRELEIFLGDMLRRAADFHIGSVRLEGARQRIRSLTPRTSAQSFVLSWSHRLSPMILIQARSPAFFLRLRLLSAGLQQGSING